MALAMATVMLLRTQQEQKSQYHSGWLESPAPQH